MEGEKPKSKKSKKEAKKADPKKFTCFNCREKGHLEIDCKKPKDLNYSLAKKEEVVEVYGMKDDPLTSREVKGRGVLESNLFINDKWVRVLFDTGASHSFISKQTAEELKLTQIFYEEPMCVINPVGGPAILCLYCKKVPISDSLHQFPRDLFIFYFSEFEILL